MRFLEPLKSSQRQAQQHGGQICIPELLSDIIFMKHSRFNHLYLKKFIEVRLYCEFMGVRELWDLY